MGKEYKWQRRERKQKSAKNRMPKHGKSQAQIYADSIEKREKDKEKLIGRINKMLMKQTPLEDTMGKNLPTIKPQQLASVTNQPMPQAAQQIKQQQTQNRQVGQNAPQQPKPPLQRSIQFGPTGADLIPNELKQRVDKFNTLTTGQQAHTANMLEKNNPQDYEMAKYLARTGSPQVQIHAVRKLTPTDLDAVVQPTNPNEDIVSVLASRTQNPSYMRNLSKHASPKVRFNLLKNPNITDLTMSEMYDDNDDQIRNYIVGKSNNQELLHLFISDKNPQIRTRLLDKVDTDGLKILLTDSDPYISAAAKRKLSGRFSKMEKAVDGKRTVFIPAEEDEIDSQLTTASKEKLPDYGYGTPVGPIGTAGGTQPSFSTKSILKSIDTLIEKAEVEPLKKDKIMKFETDPRPFNQRETPKPLENTQLHFRELEKVPLANADFKPSTIWPDDNAEVQEFDDYAYPSDEEGVPATDEDREVESVYRERFENKPSNVYRRKNDNRSGYFDERFGTHIPEEMRTERERSQDWQDKRNIVEEEDKYKRQMALENKKTHKFHPAKNIKVNTDFTIPPDRLKTWEKEWNNYTKHIPEEEGLYKYGEGGSGGRGNTAVSILGSIVSTYRRVYDIAKAEQEEGIDSNDYPKFIFVTSKRGGRSKLEGAVQYSMGNTYRNEELLHVDLLASSPRNSKDMPNRYKGVGTRLLYEIAKTALNRGIDNVELMPLQGAVPFYKKAYMRNREGMMEWDRRGMQKFVVAAEKQGIDKIGKDFDWWADMDDSEPDGFTSLPANSIKKEYGAVGDVSTATYGGSEGQNYRKKIGSALKFKSVEGVFDIMKDVSKDFNFEENNG
jgi:hypothetical protein